MTDYLTGIRSSFPHSLDTFDQLENDSDRISPGAMNKMGDAALQIQKEILGAFMECSGEGMRITSATVPVGATAPGSAYTIGVDLATEQTSAIVDMFGAENIGPTGSVIFFVDARPTSAASSGALFESMRSIEATKHFDQMTGYLDSDDPYCWAVALGSGVSVKEDNHYNGYDRSNWPSTYKTSGGSYLIKGLMGYTLTSLQMAEFNQATVPLRTPIVSAQVNSVPLSDVGEIAPNMFMLRYPNWGYNYVWPYEDDLLAYELILYSDDACSTEIARVDVHMNPMTLKSEMLPMQAAYSSDTVGSMALALKSRPGVGTSYMKVWLVPPRTATVGLLSPTHSFQWRWQDAETIEYTIVPLNLMSRAYESCAEPIEGLYISIVAVGPAA